MKTGKIPEGAEFWIVGACRGADDEAIVDSLKEMVKDMGIADSVKFLVNQPRSEIINVFKAASIALHTMKYEHFGISIVEMMAAGIITIAHNSAGPKQDIIGAAEEPVGFLAEDCESYTNILVDCAENYTTSKFNNFRFRARTWVKERFGLSAFDKIFTEKAEAALR